MRTFLLITTFVFVASFGAPLFASAQVCTTAGAACSFGGGTGTCLDNGTGDFYCNTGGIGTTGGIQSGGTGTINPTGTTRSGSNVALINPLKAGTSLETFLGDILKFVVRIGTVVIILMMVFVGYKFVVAQGEPGKITEARQALLWTVVGALVLLGSQAIAMAIEKTVQSLSAGG
ncbi:MAG: hypothetical protein WC217_02505 [Candidatus Paceibacterota bacterium]|jgi:hypothetical protein